MAKKIRVALLMGGRSAEHEVSLVGGLSIYGAIDRDAYDVTLIGIDKTGQWHIGEPAELVHHGTVKEARLNTDCRQVRAISDDGKVYIVDLKSGERVAQIDVFFLKTSGPFGEDGRLQGFLDLIGAPYVGAGVLGSAIGMDKDVMKRLLRDAGIPIGKFITLRSGEKLSHDDSVHQLGTPLFIKPANLGSSIGISKVKNEKEFDAAIAEAFKYDTKVLIEEFIDGKEVECAVLGNDAPIASVVGQLEVHHDFYSYEAKYLDENGMTPKIPADLNEELTQRVRDLSVQTFKVLCCEGMGRVDSFVTNDGRVLVNEINTIPGFTSISMYPKLWEASGIPYSELIDRLIKLAIERFEKQKGLRTIR